MVGRLNINVSPETHRELKILAAKKDKSVTALVDQAIKEFLERESK